MIDMGWLSARRPLDSGVLIALTDGDASDAGQTLSHSDSANCVGTALSASVLTQTEDTHFRHPRRSEGEARARRGSNTRSAEGSVLYGVFDESCVGSPTRARCARPVEDDGTIC